MEYEQLEHGSTVFCKAVENQDLGLYYDLLAPDVLLVTHFPYPDCANTSAAVFREATRLREEAAHPNPNKLKAALLRESRADLERRQRRYEEVQADIAGQRAARQRRGSGGGGGDNNNNQTNSDGQTSESNNNAGDRNSESPQQQQQQQQQQGNAGGGGGGASSNHDNNGGGGGGGGANGKKRAANSGKDRQRSRSRGAREESASAAANNNNSSSNGKSGGGGGHQTPAGVRFYLEPDSCPDASYGERVDVAIGPLFVSVRFCILLNWLQSAPYVAATKSTLEPRKGVLQDSEILPPPALPDTMAERYALLGRQLTERNQRLSRLVLLWGREALLFRDCCYFEDGKIVTVHRWLLPLAEMLQRPLPAPQPLSISQKTEAVKKEVLDLYGVSKSRVNAVNKSWPLLDFSFQNIETPELLLTTTPVAGKPHRSKGVRPEIDPRLAQGLFINESNDPSRAAAPARTLIKAKNKKGEEEAYEFERASKRFALTDGDKGGGDTVLGSLLHAVTTRYDASSVRISGCHLGGGGTSNNNNNNTNTNNSNSGGGGTSGGSNSNNNNNNSNSNNNNSNNEAVVLARLVPALRGLVANAYVSIHSLDLSDNCLTQVPDLSLLPIRKLLLHGNRIAEWRTVEAHVCTLPLLHAVTLHGNPLARSDPNYWPGLLSRLVRAPGRLVQLRSVDFVSLSAQDYHVAGAHEMFTTGQTTVYDKARTMLRN